MLILFESRPRCLRAFNRTAKPLYGVLIELISMQLLEEFGSRGAI
jgi:hypothetical protein